MADIAYLFGAGASRGALPIVNEIPVRLENFIAVLKLDDLSKVNKFKNGNCSYYDAQQVLIDDLYWLSKQSENHASIDTLAKKLYLLHDNENLTRLKLSLSVFFIFEQLKHKPDNRYDVFFASLLTTEVNTLPGNIRVISWNYDYQFEFGFSEFLQKKSLKSNQAALNVISKYNQETSSRKDCFTIYKLNGATNLRTPDNQNEILFLNDLNTDFNLQYFEQILDKYMIARFNADQYTCTLSFAWEDLNNYPESFVNATASKLNNTEILVVIGYSFPFFNRVVDRKIIGAMDKLHKVYIQSPDADNVKERFEGIIANNKKINFIIKRDVDQFFLPNEL